MKPFTNMDYFWKPLVALLMGLFILQLIFSRHAYDVTIYTYRIMQSYYLNKDDIIISHTTQVPSNVVNRTGTAIDSNTIPSNFPTGMDMNVLTTAISTRENESEISTLTSISPDIAIDEGDNGKKNRSLGMCNPELDGPFLYVAEAKSASSNQLLGGEWQPNDCNPISSVALIIPFRARHAHLRTFLPYIHSFLQKQLLHYRVYVIEQYDNSTFNRAKLLNIGYKEASKDFPYTCYVYHDVDLLPLDERNLYNCSNHGPLHMAAAIDKWGFNMPYDGFFGGVCAFTPKQMEKINGFSNRFFGWGGEDDDIDARIRLSGQRTQRHPLPIARYHMIRHGADKGNEANPLRFAMLQETRNNWKEDGLNSLKYNIVNVELNNLCTKIYANVS